jgi:heme/copper-type cytochrome/quinol oxidase subunit 2
MKDDLRRKIEERWWSLWRMIGTPVVWSLHFLFCYVYAAVRCAKSGRFQPLDDIRLAIAIATILALMVVAVSGYSAWRHTRIEGDPPPHDESTLEDRHRFLAMAELLLAGLSFVAILYTAIPAFIFVDCR